MKKKLVILLFSCLLAVLLSSCDELLSVVTADENGEKVVNNYVPLFGDTVYEKDASLKSWQNITLLKETGDLNLDDLLFTIENKKENIVVLGDKDAAVELTFFDGGYNYKLFSSVESLNEAMSNINF